MNVETTPELILAAAEKCPQAKEALKTLFPKVFEEEKSFDCYSLGQNQYAWELGSDHEKHPCIGVSNRNRKGFFLATTWDWKIEDNFLIPTRK